jgi:hypothetical protein
VPLQVSAIMIGVENLARQEVLHRGLGLRHRPGLSQFRLVQTGRRFVVARPLRVGGSGPRCRRRPEGSGFRGVSFHHIVPTREAVDEVMSSAKNADGAVVREPLATQWGYFEYFSDPDGHLWKIASAS